MKLDLKLIAAQLEGLEETIIAKLIDRAQFCINQCIYKQGDSGFEGENYKSLFELRLLHQETMDAQFGRFHVPEERPFNTNLPEASRKVIVPSTGLHLGDINSVNLTGEIMQSYHKLIHRLCKEGDDQQYGSSVEHDVYALQAISRRIHFGAMYVAESKYSGAPEEYAALIAVKNIDALMEKLTRKEVEEKIIHRIYEKVETIQSQANPDVRHLIDPEIVVDYYRDTVIPLTKDGEIAYLLQRK